MGNISNVIKHATECIRVINIILEGCAYVAVFVLLLYLILLWCNIITFNWLQLFLFIGIETLIACFAAALVQGKNQYQLIVNIASRAKLKDEDGAIQQYLEEINKK